MWRIQEAAGVGGRGPWGPGSVRVCECGDREGGTPQISLQVSSLLEGTYSPAGVTARCSRTSASPRPQPWTGIPKSLWVWSE